MSIELDRVAVEEGAPIQAPVLASGAGVPLIAGEVGSCTSRSGTWMLPTGPEAQVTFLREATRDKIVDASQVPTKIGRAHV